MPVSRESLKAGAWYWYVLDASNLAPYNALQRDKAIRVTRTQGDWLLFQATRAFQWPADLPGLPTPAPKGPDTDRSDTIQAPPPEPDIVDQLPTPGEVAKGVSRVATAAVWAAAGLAAAVILARRSN